MSDQSSPSSFEQPNTSSVAIGSSSPNGIDAEGVVGASDESFELSGSTDGEPADELPTASTYVAEPTISATPDEGSVFLAELVRAWHTTAGLERIRIDEDTERRRQAHVDRVRAREASEAERIRELAREDMNAIEAWADGEKERIKLERQRRMTELHDDLDLSLAKHRSKIDLEVEGVETRIATYRAEVEAFFGRLDGETDLVLIAQQAAMRPVFPTLDEVPTAAVAAAVDAADAVDAVEVERPSPEAPPAGADDDATGGIAGMTERSAVGVMDPQTVTEPVASWADRPEPGPEAVPADTSAGVDAGAEGEPAEPVTVASGSSVAGSGALLQSMAVKQPMGWLRRHANGGDQTNGES